MLVSFKGVVLFFPLKKKKTISQQLQLLPFTCLLVGANLLKFAFWLKKYDYYMIIKTVCKRFFSCTLHWIYFISIFFFERKSSFVTWTSVLSLSCFILTQKLLLSGNQ